MSDANPHQDPRRSARIGLSAEIKLRRAGQSGYRVKIHDISPEGCRAEFVERPRLDERVWVKFQGLEGLESIVCWVRGLEVGLEFEHKIHPTVFEHLVSKFIK